MSLKRARSSLGPPPRSVKLRSGVSRAEAAAIAKRAAIRTSTKKSHQRSFVLSTDNTGNQANLSEIALGANDYQRVGGGVLPVSMTIRWNWRVNSTLGAIGTRVVLIRSHLERTSIQIPTLGGTLDLTPNGTAITVGTEHLAGMKIQSLSTHDVIMDVGEIVNSFQPVDGAGHNSGKWHERTFKLGTKAMVFTDAGTTGVNKFYLMSIVNTVAASDLQVVCSLNYIDK